MKKSLFKILILNFILIVSFVYLFNINIRSNVYAEEEVIEHKHEDDETAVYQPWSDPKSLPKTTGYYYLTCDIKWDYPWEPEGDVHLCLNGHGIKRTGIGYVIRTTSNCKLCISDCNSINQVHKYKVTDGGEKIGLAVVDDTLTENYETFSGGYITGGRGVTEGGAIVLDGLTTDEVQFKMTGGTIIGNYTTGNGAAIACNVREEDRTCKAEVSNVNIIGNVAPYGHSAAIYYNGTNSSLTLSNVNISNNISSDIPAGIKNTGALKLKGKIYIYDNKTSNGEEADITINSDNNTHSLAVEELSEDSKIGYYQINGKIIDYYKYNSSKDINKIFISSTYQLLEREENDGVFSNNYSDDYTVLYDGEYHTLVLNPALDGFIDNITYGDKKGSYYNPQPSKFKEVGVYHIYYIITTFLETFEGEQKITILDTRSPIGRNDLYYTGEPQELVTLEDYPDVSYTYKMDGGYWSNFIPKGVDVGEYIINVRIHDEVKQTTSEGQIKASIKPVDKIPLLDEINVSTLYYDSISEKYSSIAETVEEVIEDANALYKKVNATESEITDMISRLKESVTAAEGYKKQVDDVIAAIDAIGDVTLEKKEQIDGARALYINIPEEFHALVTNYLTLVMDEFNYSLLVTLEERVNTVIDAIDAIGDVIYDDATKAKINDARSKYNLLPNQLKAKVSNFATLEEKEATYANLVSDHAAANDVIEKISSIGTVLYTDETKAKLDEARGAYDALSDAQKPLVTNYQTLTDAEELYASFVLDDEAANNVDDLINAIGDVTYSEECKAKIDEAIAAYDALTDAQKELVLNYNALTVKERQYANLAEDYAAAASVDDLINAIGEVVYTKESEEKIQKAKSAYKTLTEARRVLVKNIATLTTAEKIYLDLDKTYKAIDSIDFVEYNDESKQKIEAARVAYNSLDEETKAKISNYDKLTSSEEKYNNLGEQHKNKIFILIGTGTGVLLVVALVVVYMLMFFVFNKIVIINAKRKRVFKLGTRKNKIKLLKMNFRIIYRDPVDVYEKKA